MHSHSKKTETHFAEIAVLNTSSSSVSARSFRNSICYETQDGSPHGRPAGRAALAGAARAVKAAGLVPVGVCNTSHDVLQLASAQGLPEVRPALCLSG